MKQTVVPLQTIPGGFVVAVIGFFSSFPILIQALTNMGASPEQVASGLMMAALSMGIAGIGLSLWTKEPASVAWSTPGAALLAVSHLPQGGYATVIVGLLVAGVLTVVAAYWRPLSRFIAAIPAALAQAMLAGVLLSLCLQPFNALSKIPTLALPIVLAWLVAGWVNRFAAVPCAVFAAAIVVALQPEGSAPMPPVLSAVVWVTPEFSVEAVLSFGLPLFLVTMATQNIPGIAILRAYGYRAKTAPLIGSVGVASILVAPFGAITTCLAAVTAAMCAGEDSHPDTKKRYWTAIFTGVFYCVFGLCAGLITWFAGLAPPLVLGTVTGVALLGVFANSVVSSLEEPSYRQAATITFLTTASGLSMFGLSAPVWGLVFGLVLQSANDRLRKTA